MSSQERTSSLSSSTSTSTSLSTISDEALAAIAPKVVAKQSSKKTTARKHAAAKAKAPATKAGAIKSTAKASTPKSTINSGIQKRKAGATQKPKATPSKANLSTSDADNDARLPTPPDTSSSISPDSSFTTAASSTPPPTVASKLPLFPGLKKVFMLNTVARKKEKIERPPGVYYAAINHAASPRIPVEVGDWVVRRRTKENIDTFGQRDEHDVFDGPWRVTRFNQHVKGLKKELDINRQVSLKRKEPEEDNAQHEGTQPKKQKVEKEEASTMPGIQGHINKGGKVEKKATPPTKSSTKLDTKQPQKPAKKAAPPPVFTKKADTKRKRPMFDDSDSDSEEEELDFLALSNPKRRKQNGSSPQPEVEVEDESLFTLTEKNMLGQKVMLSFPTRKDAGEASKAPQWCEIGDLIPLHDELPAGSELVANSCTIAKMEGFRKLNGEQAIAPAEAERSTEQASGSEKEGTKEETTDKKGVVKRKGKTGAKAQDPPIWLAEIKPNVFSAVIDLPPVDGDSYKAEKLRGKRVRVLLSDSEEVKENKLETERDDVWVKRLLQDKPNLCKDKVVVTEYMVHWVGWASEDNEWQPSNAISKDVRADYNKVADMQEPKVLLNHEEEEVNWKELN